jgi:hypothetical protein
MSGQQSEWISRAEDIADKITRQTKHVLPHLARFCLVSTFFEEGVRMWVQWTEQREYMDISWGCGWFMATMFVVLNLLGQLGGVAMVLFRFRVDIACVVLFSIVCLQTVAYSILWDMQFLFRNLALIGALLLVLAESRVEGRSLFPGVPSLGENKPKEYLHCKHNSSSMDKGKQQYVTLPRTGFFFLLLKNVGTRHGALLIIIPTIFNIQQNSNTLIFEID